ncbi:MAG TPA: RNA degradosome polyphosphate kinase [Dehalococcoidia bacterium]|nr:RNA degradosome polyphosphate kinase [Dehalococcoidia bacterium]
MVANPRERVSLRLDESVARYLNREMSDLQFKMRVLERAEDASLPLLERAKFLSIVATNLDEFYMVRVAGLKRQQSVGLATLSADGLTPTQQLALISSEVAVLMERHARVFVEEVMPALQRRGIRLRRWRELLPEQQTELQQVFRERIFPILTPLAVDPGHPFPYISNRSLNLAVFVQDEQGKVHFARVKVPPLLPRFMSVAGAEPCFVPLEDIIAANLGDLFTGMRILEWHTFRVTRDAELEVDDDGAEDLLAALEQELSRRRFSRATRLEVENGTPAHLLSLLMRELGVGDDDVFELPGPLDLSALMQFYELDRPDLKDAPFQPANHPNLVKPDDSVVDIFNVLKTKDILVHHPYESFANSVQLFIEQAAADPDVLAIKQTLYRTSGESPIVDALTEAAEAGKQVVVLVEIKARFDEIANINWARTLERAGCHVVYGLMGLKTHCKLCMVVRSEGDTLRRYVHIGTGNYNPATARVYEDIGLLTADEKLGADIGNLFNYLTGYSRHESYASLLVAPHEMRRRMLGLIQRETKIARRGEPARIIFKMNALVDEAIIDGLYEASQAGVSIDVICRGICALRPGVPGLSENIRVRSIIGRYLEHSRMYYFANAGAEQLYIGSADMMHRNLDRRVEVLVRVESPGLKSRLLEILDLALADNAGAWRLGPQAEWTRLSASPDEAPRDLQKELMQRAGQAQ